MWRPQVWVLAAGSGRRLTAQVGGAGGGGVMTVLVVELVGLVWFRRYVCGLWMWGGR